jgi:hypothetical protein
MAARQVQDAERATGAPGRRPVEPAGELVGGIHGGHDHAGPGLDGGFDRPADQFLGPGTVQAPDKQVHHPEAQP